MNKRSTWTIIGLIALFLCLFAIGVVTDVISFGVQQGQDFFYEQQPQADSLGDAIGKQYSQLRELAASLDDVSCRISNAETLYAELQQVYEDQGSEANWPEDAREEARNYRQEIGALRQTYSKVAKEYNVLRTDIRTIADNLGLEVDDIPEAKENSPDGVCGNFELPLLSELEDN